MAAPSSNYSPAPDIRPNMGVGNWFGWLSRVVSGEREDSPGGGEVTGEAIVLLSHKERERRSDSDGYIVTEDSYSFTMQGRCLDGPPASWGRRRSSSLITDVIGRRLGGSFSSEPEDMVDSPSSPDDNTPVCNLSTPTQHILRRIFSDLNPEEIVDYHMHLVGHGDSGSGCHLHYSTKSWWYPLRRIKTAVFMFAAQVPDMEGGDVQFISRLVRLVKHLVPASVLDPSKPRSQDAAWERGYFPAYLSSFLSLPLPTVPLFQHGYLHGKFCLLAFDKFYEKNGQPNQAKTTLYVPNDYAFSMAREYSEYFCPIGSVNPYRPDALEELERCSKKGVAIIKWLPNSMGIDPSDEKCVPFYHKMRELDMALLVHSGDEHSVDAAFLDNSLGNPLLLKKPLDCGIKVIAAHCATEGYAVDWENGNASVPCFDLFLRLMREEKYKDLLFGDISAVCAFKRVPYLPALLQATDIHSRLVYGSDYPVPAINLVVHTSKLRRYGLITAEECSALNELYNYNPLLFDITSKRLIRGQNGEKFPPSVFKAHPSLPPSRPYQLCLC